MTPEQLKAEIIFNKHSWKELGAISPSKRFCVPAMLEYASIVSAEKDKEIAELKSGLSYWKGIAETPEVGKKTIEQFLERELAAAKDRIAELEKEVVNVLDALCDMWNQYCGDKYGHMCMSAGENAANVLDKYKLLKNDNGYGGEVDWDKLTELKTRGQSSNNL